VSSVPDKLTLPGERVDSLGRGGLFIIQSPNAFSFSVDAVLLAHYASVANYEEVVDLCTGTAVIPLLLSTRAIGLKQIGVELCPEAADRAARSVTLNNLSDGIQIIQGDVKQVRGLLPAKRVSLVTANPPYLPLGQGLSSCAPSRRMARHEVTISLNEVVSAAAYLLGTGGRFAMVHRAFRLTDVLTALRGHRLEPKRLRLVHPKEGESAQLVLIESVKDAKASLSVAPPLMIHQSDGHMTEELQELYAGGAMR